MKNGDLTKLEKKLGYKFSNRRFLAQAITHSSYLNENPGSGVENNERLEFLGDSILSFLVAQTLFKRFSNIDEGDLTNYRSMVVRTSTLSKIAKKLELGKFLRLSKGEKEAGGNKNPNLLANVYEAVLGAIFLDGSLPACEKFIKKTLMVNLSGHLKNGGNHDFKGKLQILVQEKFHAAPSYQVLTEVGPDHAKKFEVGVFLQDKFLAKAEGSSVKEASQKAAKAAVRLFVN